MNEILGIAAFPVIVIMVYVVGYICKQIKNETLDRFIPAICGIVGAILGVIIFLTIPNFMPADNWAIAIAVGIVSGFAATGINQVVKQFTKKIGG